MNALITFYAKKTNPSLKVARNSFTARVRKWMKDTLGEDLEKLGGLSIIQSCSECHWRTFHETESLVGGLRYFGSSSAAFPCTFVYKQGDEDKVVIKNKQTD